MVAIQGFFGAATDNRHPAVEARREHFLMAGVLFAEPFVRVCPQIELALFALFFVDFLRLQFIDISWRHEPAMCFHPGLLWMFPVDSDISRRNGPAVERPPHPKELPPAGDFQ